MYNAERTVETFVKRFGAERLLVGSDSAPSLNLQIVRDAQISPEEKQMVLSGNARKSLNLWFAIRRANSEFGRLAQ